MNYYNIYSDFLNKFFDISRPIKVVVDCSNGTTSPVLRLWLENLKFKIINGKPDGNFPAHGPNPLKPGAMSQLQKEVKKNKADLGIIFDADGDRVFFVDNLGRFVDPDVIAYLLARKFNYPFIVDVRTGKLIEELKKPFIKSRVGHYFIKKIMRKNKIEFAAERSGHYYFNPVRSLARDFVASPKDLGEATSNGIYIDSGILAAGLVLSEISRLPYSFSDLVDLLPQYYRSGEINLKVKSPDEVIKKIESKYKGKSEKISHLDGLTMEFKNYWFNLRPSNTEQVIRLNIEGLNKEVVSNKIKELKRVISLL